MADVSPPPTGRGHPSAAAASPPVTRLGSARCLDARGAPVADPPTPTHPHAPIMGVRTAGVPLATVDALQAAEAALVAAARRAETALSSVAPVAGLLAPPPSAPIAARVPRGSLAAPSPCPRLLLRAPVVRSGAGALLAPARSPSVASVAPVAVRLALLPAARRTAVASPVAPPCAAVEALGLSASADGAGRAGGARVALAFAAGRAVGWAAAATKLAAVKKRKRPAATVSSLEADLHDGADWWAGAKRTRVGEEAAGENRRAYIPSVPPQMLDSVDPTKKMLQDLCTARTISFGVADAVESFKTSLRRLNASSATTWGAQMQFALVLARARAQRGWGALVPFQAGMRHPLGVGVDGGSAPEASARIPAPAVAPLFRKLTRQTQPPAAIDGSAASPPPALASHSRPSLYSATPSQTLYPHQRFLSLSSRWDPSPRPPLFTTSPRPSRNGALPASGEVSPHPSSGGSAPPFRRPSTN